MEVILSTETEAARKLENANSLVELRWVAKRKDHSAEIKDLFMTEKGAGMELCSVPRGAVRDQ